MYNICKCGEKVPSWEGHMCVACCAKLTVTVATITTSAAREMHRPQESASAYHIVNVPAGTYPVQLRTNGKGQKYLAALFTGTVVSSGYGGRRYREFEGQIDTVRLSPYKYELRAGKFWGKVEILDAAALETAPGV